VVIDLRHKHEIDTPLRERKLVCGRPPKYDRARCRFPPGLVDHLLGWIEPDDPRTKFGCQHLGKAPGATAKIDDHRDRAPVESPKSWTRGEVHLSHQISGRAPHFAVDGEPGRTSRTSEIAIRPIEADDLTSNRS
jgi:hypothetical protein